MSGPKILVLQMKDLIKIGAIAIGGIILVVVALVLLLGGSGDSQTPETDGIFVPGIYASTIILNDKPLEVRVTVSDTEILDIYLTDKAEIQRIFFPLFEPRMADLAVEVLHHQTTAIDPATDYPVTTDILHRAVKAALELAVVR